MKVLLYIFLIPTVYILVGSSMNAVAQDETIVASLPVSDEAVKLFNYPLKFDADVGISTARVGEDRLYQTDLTIVEIPPGGQLPPVKHLAEEIIYIIAGEGVTTMWVRAGEKPQHYQWSAGDMITPSLNAWHQHINTSSDTPARYVTMTSTPLSKNLFHNKEFLPSSDYVFEERWQTGITQQPEYKGTDTMDMLAGHFIADLPGRKLQTRSDGSTGITIRPDGDMAGNHILQMLVREYKGVELLPIDGHTHPWEVVYFVLEGEGSTLLKRGDEPARIVNWEKGDMFIVEANEYHDNGARVGSDPSAMSPRIMQMRASGYFFGVGNVGKEDHSPIKLP